MQEKQKHVEEEEEGGKEEEDLDDALEREFQRPLAGNSPPQPTVADYQTSPSSLTFSFPGWGIEIYRDSKRHKPSVIRHEFFQQLQNQDAEDSSGPQKLACGHADNPGNGNSIYKMPDEIILKVFRRLCTRDLCSAIQTCHWWQHMGSNDELWERFESDNNKNQLSLLLPRSTIVKNNALYTQVLKRASSSHGHLSKAFSHLRNALYAWWETGVPDEPYSSKTIRGLVQKMTVNDWTVLYEFLGVIFSERADCLAAILLREAEKQADKNDQHICPVQCNGHQMGTDKEELSSGPDFSNRGSSAFQSSKEVVSPFESSVGRSLWSMICIMWKRYKHWLMLIFEHCPGLNQEVMIEKARATIWMTTPTLYEKGIICFRSQVLLKYGLRRLLQSALSSLTLNDAIGTTSEVEVELLRSIYHLLQEVDVRDDSLAPKNFTQTKLRRCFSINR